MLVPPLQELQLAAVFMTSLSRAKFFHGANLKFILFRLITKEGKENFLAAEMQKELQSNLLLHLYVPRKQSFFHTIELKV